MTEALDEIKVPMPDSTGIIKTKKQSSDAL